MERAYILNQRLFTLFMGVNAEYGNVKSQIFRQKKVPDLEEGIGFIMEEES